MERAAAAHRFEVEEAIRTNNGQLREENLRLKNELSSLKIQLSTLTKQHEDSVALLVKEYEEKKAADEKEIKAAATSKAVQVVLTAKIKLAWEAEAKGLDVSFWDVDGWIERLVKLGGKVPEREEEEAKKEGAKEEEGEKEEAKEATQDEEMVSQDEAPTSEVQA